ncbi:MAG: hypothetical protein ITG01_09440 [Comamonas sp.]|nr:hypothetical protein [Comamonas sp.]
MEILEKFFLLVQYEKINFIAKSIKIKISRLGNIRILQICSALLQNWLEGEAHFCQSIQYGCPDMPLSILALKGVSHHSHIQSFDAFHPGLHQPLPVLATSAFWLFRSCRLRSVSTHLALSI